MKTFLVFAAVVGVVASALPSVARDPSEVAFVEVHGPGFVKEFDLSSKSKEDKVFQPNGPDLRPFEVEQARNKGEEIDPAIIWAIGKALWDFIEKNSAVENITTDWGGAVPDGVTDWTQLDEWQDGTWTSDNGTPFKFIFKNFLGIHMGELQWIWSFKYGGQYNSAGQYLTLAMPIVQHVDVYATERVSCTTKVWNPVNYGSTGTPVGGVDLEVDCKYSDPVKSSGVGMHVVIRGDNQFHVVTVGVH